MLILAKFSGYPIMTLHSAEEESGSVAAQDPTGVGGGGGGVETEIYKVSQQQFPSWVPTPKKWNHTSIQRLVCKTSYPHPSIVNTWKQNTCPSTDE